MTTLTLLLTLDPDDAYSDSNRPSRPYKKIFVCNSKQENFNASKHAMY